MMESAAKLAGFFGAHAVWSVSDGSVLVPLVGIEMTDGTRKLHRFSTERIEEGTKRAQDFFARNPEGAANAALVYDGFLTLPGVGKIDGLIVEAQDYASGCSMRMGLPYRPASSPKGFAVHRPKFLAFSGFEPDYEVIGGAFFEGVDGHEKAAAVWAEHLDESI